VRRFIRTKLFLFACLMLPACDGGKLLGNSTVPKEDVSLLLTYQDNGWAYWMYTSWDDKEFDSQLIISGSQTLAAQTDCPTNAQGTIKIPVGKRVKMLVSSNAEQAGVCVPQYGIKLDAVPGLITEVYFTPLETGTICGTCLGEDGDLLTNSTFVLEIIEP